MTDTTTPIELTRNRRSRAPQALHRIRVAGRFVHLALVLAVVVGVFVQVYLIGSYIFGAGQSALDAHRTAGWTVHGLEMLVFVAALVAWLPWVDVVLSLSVAAVGTVQVSLASEHRWVGGLHPLLALVVVGIAGALALRAVRRRRDARFLHSSATHSS
jgi:asparagine N-glycosylation enzyme membrane subunit Stt3